jgi:hypothetical protein
MSFISTDIIANSKWLLAALRCLILVNMQFAENQLCESLSLNRSRRGFSKDVLSHTPEQYLSFIVSSV